MSNDTHSHNPADPHGYGIEPAVSPENESLPVGTIALIAIVSCTCFALGILWAVQIQNGVENENEKIAGPWHKGEFEGKPEVGIVDQTVFEKENRAVELAKQKHEKLEQYAWVSRKDGLIQIPIEEAMKAIVSGKRPPKTEGATAPAPAPGTQGATGGTGATGTPAPGAPAPTTPAAPGGAQGKTGAAPAPGAPVQGGMTGPGNKGAGPTGAAATKQNAGQTGATGSTPSGKQ